MPVLGLAGSSKTVLAGDTYMAVTVAAWTMRDGEGGVEGTAEDGELPAELRDVGHAGTER